MPLYCFYCPTCGRSFETLSRDTSEGCPACFSNVVRDYRAEGVGVSMAALESRKADWHDILPTVDDFKKPNDPDGLKGFAKWRSENRPKTPGARHPQEHLLRRSVAV